MAANYFTCTLGQAVVAKSEGKSEGHDSQTINDLLEHQANVYGTRFAAAFAYPEPHGSSTLNGKQRHKIYTFANIRNGARYVSKLLYNTIDSATNHHEKLHGRKSGTVALLCPSTPEFLFAWLGLIRLGYAVLLVAPQCQPEAIVHLCKACDVKILFYDAIYQDLACRAAETSSRALQSVQLGFSIGDEEFDTAMAEDLEIGQRSHCSDRADVAYLHHTSGTSSGLPKPIAQTHRAACGVLPHFPEGYRKATFTTTPLYHGGVADVFRAWTSSAPIWLFPGKSLDPEGKSIQITAGNVLSCLHIAKNQDHIPDVKYFSSVPYVLQTLASLPEGLAVLKEMECVGVGGAALPVEVGDDLVSQGVNLLSRFGSAECGFLASSHRNYEEDKEWQYLRFGKPNDMLEFRATGDGRHELIVLARWPHRAVQNSKAVITPDDPYPTADLFVPHPSIPNAWKYDSRADSQLTLITGKKFDPAPLEDAIAVSPLLDDVLIFGNERPFPGALLFRSSHAGDMSDDDLIAQIAPRVEQLNSKSQDHARIPKNMLRPVADLGAKLEKSSKGTILRKSAEATHKNLIDPAYTRLDASISDTVPDDLLSSKIQEAVKAITGYDVGPDQDLYSYGVDSVGSIQLRHMLQRLLPADADKLPMTVVEDGGSVERLTRLIVKRRAGNMKDESDDDLTLMQDLVERYSDFSSLTPSITNGLSGAVPDEDGETVILTGATGSLGAHLLHLYRSSPEVSNIYCLVRGASVHAARERVNKSLTSRCLPNLDLSLEIKHGHKSPKVTVLPCKISAPDLGLEPETYSLLAQHTTLLIHAAWTVNFRLRLRSFVEDHIAGTRHLLNLFLSSGPDTYLPQSQAPEHQTRPRKFIFCSSTASVAAQAHPTSTTTTRPVPESLSTNPNDASPLGYSRSKHVAESILGRLVEQHPSLRASVAILRIGQLSGDTIHGVWNATEAWPLMLGSVRATGCLPDLGRGVLLDWLGVDVAARAVVEIAASIAADSVTFTETDHSSSDNNKQSKDDNKTFKQIQIYHVLQPHATATWTDLLSWLSATEKFETLPPHAWVRRLDALQHSRPEYPALKLLEVWRAAYAADEPGGGNGREAGTAATVTRDDVLSRYETAKARALSATLRDVKGVDREYFRRLWGWIAENVDG